MMVKLKEKVTRQIKLVECELGNLKEEEKMEQNTLKKWVFDA